ncbi:MAG: hypothetical protein KAK00_05710 [Nanoarchaeota archaeon]|nr:hypothetical protein [Nanoarchaeota archaeon]
MGQASVFKFLQKYKKSALFKKKKWLTVKEIYEKMKKTRDSSAIGSTTTSIKKLRDSGMIKFKEIRTEESCRMIFHYQAK